MVTLPVASKSSAGYRRPRAVRLPNAGDVPTVGAGALRDPGVSRFPQASPETFGAAEGRALQQFGQATGQLAEDVADIAFKLRRQQQASDLARVTSDASVRLKEAEFQLETDPDYATREERYNATADQIFNELSQGLDDTVKSAFEAEFLQSRQTIGFNVRRDARKRQIDAGAGQLERNMDTWADLYARADTDAERDDIRRKVQLELAEASQVGLITEESRAKRELAFGSRAEKTQVNGLILANPEAAEALLFDESQFQDLTPEDRVSLQARAQAAAESARTERRAEADRQDRLAEKRMKATGDAALKDAYDILDRGGTLSPAYLDQVRSNPGVSPAEYKGLVELTHKEGTTEDDAEFLQNIMPRLHDEDLISELGQGLAAGKLQTGTYRTLINQNKAALADNQPDSPYKSGRDFLSVGLDPGQLGGDGTIRQPLAIARASALADYDAFWQASPETTRTQAVEKAREIMTQYQNVAFDQMRLALPRPRGFAGSKQDVTIEAVNSARQALFRNIQAGEITTDEAAREIEALDVWEGILSRQETNQ